MRHGLPTLVPNVEGHTFYLVIERYRDNAFFPETSLDRTDLDQLIADLSAGQYDEPLEIVAFNPTASWSQNVTEDIAGKLQRRADFSESELSEAAASFIARNTRADRQLSLRLVR